MVYVQKFRTICNSLAAIGDPVSYSDQLQYFLNGLGVEYNAFVTSLHNRSDRPSMEEVHSLLLSHDARLDRQNSVAQLSSLQANMAHMSLHPSKPNFVPPSSSRYRPPSSERFHPHPPLSQTHLQSQRLPWSHSSRSSPRPRCQICLKRGHLASM